MKYFGKSILAATLLVGLAACGGQSEEAVVTEESLVTEGIQFERPILKGLEYKGITDDIVAKGIVAMNDETGEATFEVYCFGDQDVVKDCMSQFSEMNEGEVLTEGTVMVDGLERSYAYQMRK